MNKDELIMEINEQLKGLEIIVEASDGISVKEAVMLYDLQFRLKCKLYELSNDK